LPASASDAASVLTVLARSVNEKAGEAEPEGVRCWQPSRGYGAAAGARSHQPVDVRVHYVVERARPAAGEREAGHAADRYLPRGHAAGASH
jgi:hypothetical protein